MEQIPAPDHWKNLERQVIRLVAQGYTNLEIACEVLLSERTVARLVNLIVHNLGLCDRLDLILYGIVHGFVDRSPAP